MKHNAKPYTVFGKTFKSEKDLLAYYNISKTVFHRYLQKGENVEYIIQNHQRKDKIQDQYGNTFKNITSLLNHYNISESVYLYHKKKNENINEIIKHTGQQTADHLGNIFPTKKEMCKYWNISINSYKRRIRNGWPMEKALTEPMHRPNSLPKYVKTDKVKTHLIIQKHIKNGYFECIYNNSKMILSRYEILNIAKNIIEKDET